MGETRCRITTITLLWIDFTTRFSLDEIYFPMQK